jgi:hypothetical protein
MERLGFGTRIGNQHVKWRVLGVVDLDYPVPIVVKRACVEQLILRIEFAPTAVFIEQVLIGECTLRIVVASTIPGMTRQRVDIPPVLLGVLAMVGLA